MATIASPRSSSPAILPIASPSLQSTTDTPTSSVRPSIELPSNPVSGQPTNGQPNTQRRNRAALRDYYNLKAKPASTSATASPATSTHNLSRTASITSIASDSTHVSSATLTSEHPGGGPTLPTTLDDPSFDAEAYIANLLKTSSLKDILRTESSLVSEIRNLDGERKALVYDNYSKLIVAVGTIGEMQRGIVEDGRRGQDSGLGRMQGLESKLDELMNDFRETSGEGGRGGGGSGEERKARIEERKRVREQRRNQELVKWVLGAEGRLKAMLEAGNRDEAEAEWKEVETLLEKWKDVKGTNEVREACEKVLKEEGGGDEERDEGD